MTLPASVTLTMDAKLQYLSTLLREEVLHQFDLMSADMEGTNPLTVEKHLRLTSYFFPVNCLSKKKRAMRLRMSKPHGLKIRRYVNRLVGFNEYFDSFSLGRGYEKLV